MNFWSFIRSILLGVVMSLMGYPLSQNGVNWNSVFILSIFIIIFEITDEIAKKKAKQTLTDKE